MNQAVTFEARNRVQSGPSTVLPGSASPRLGNFDTRVRRDPRKCVAPTVGGFLPDGDRYRHLCR